MSWPVAKEILILAVSLSLFPLFVLVALASSESPLTALSMLSSALFSGGAATPRIWLWAKLIAPYFVLQAIRAFLWAERSRTGRRWAHLYFAVLLAFVGGWYFWRAWDLFYFMTALGDMPEELGQFIELEGTSVLIFLVCLLIGWRCFRIFLNPEKGLRPKPSGQA